MSDVNFPFLWMQQCILSVSLSPDGWCFHLQLDELDEVFNFDATNGGLEVGDSNDKAHYVMGQILDRTGAWHPIVAAYVESLIENAIHCYNEREPLVEN